MKDAVCNIRYESDLKKGYNFFRRQLNSASNKLQIIYLAGNIKFYNG